jgi:predicted permease
MRWRRRKQREQDLERELRSDVELEAEEQREKGLSPEDARYAALRAFGNPTYVREEIRTMWGWIWFERRKQDLQYAIRVLRKTPVFTTAAVLALALGIGANSAIFSILHALVLRSLPVSDPERLVVVTRNETVSSPYPLFVELRDHSQTLEGVFAFRTASMRLTKDGETERVTGVLVSGTYFDVLGLSPSIGTAITTEDDRIPGSGGPRGPVAVLSHSYWMRRFGGRADVLGTRIVLNGYPFTVVGVSAPQFSGTEVGESPDVFAPMMMQEALLSSMGKALTQPRNQWLRIFGRLNPGTEMRQAEAELTTLLHQYNQEYWLSGGITDTGTRRRLLEQKIVLLPGSTGISGLRSQYAKPLWVLMSVVAMVLLIACANVAGLLLSRATVRRGEIAVRLSLGAGRTRLIAQLFSESLLLAVAGAGSGLILARWMRDLLIRYLPAGRTIDVPMDWHILLFTLAASIGTALVFGLLPAFQTTNIDLASAIKGTNMTTRSARVSFRKLLVVIQVGLSCLLLIGAALFLRSLHNLLTVDPGFARQSILIASVEGGPGLDARLLEGVKHLPGVVSAGLADSPPLGINTGWMVFVAGYTPTANEPAQTPWVGFISSGYFETMGIPLLLGRDIDEHDVVTKRNVMVVNETFARHFFGHDNPVGRTLGMKEGVYDWEIIGVVKDSKYTGLREEPIRMMYVPARPGPWVSRTIVHLRTSGNPSALASALRQKVHELDKSATIFNVHPVQEELERSVSRERLLGTITSLFGALALLLAVIGLYGLVAYGVARRTREFAIRIAVGAKAGGIVRLVLREALWLLAVGTAVGLGAAWVLGRLISSMLFGIEPADPLSAAVAVLVLAVVALVAAWIPARRASRIHPMAALKYE